MIRRAFKRWLGLPDAVASRKDLDELGSALDDEMNMLENDLRVEIGDEVENLETKIECLECELRDEIETATVDES